MVTSGSYVQLLMVAVVELLLLATYSGAHLIYPAADGPPFDQGFPPPQHHLHHPLMMRYDPPPPPPPPLHHLYRVPVPAELWLLPPPLRGVFPPFVERIVQRIQTYWSVYNPPEQLTKPPPPPLTTTTTTTTAQPVSKRVTTPTPADTTPGAADAETTTDADDTSPTSAVATLDVLEVTPAEPRPLVDDHEPPGYLTAERASLLRDRDAFLKFLRHQRPLPRPDGLDDDMDDR